MLHTETWPDSPLCVMPEASGLNVLLSTDEFAPYHLHVTRIFTELKPVSQTECELVQRIASTEWRLNRIARSEMGIFAAGRLQFAALFPDQEPNVRHLLIDNHTLSVFNRSLNNLSLQESRLRRYHAEDLKTYTQLQKQRLAEAESAAASAKTHSKPVTASAAAFSSLQNPGALPADFTLAAPASPEPSAANSTRFDSPGRS